MNDELARNLVVDLCKSFYDLGWCTGTGGGISIRVGERIFMAPSGVQKERIAPGDCFVLDGQGAVLESPNNEGLTLTACAPLFFNAFRQRAAGAVIHSHSLDAVMATLSSGTEFRARGVEMIKGLRGHGYYDEVVVPVIENTAHECDLAESMSAAIDAYPQSDAVLVRRHGVYVWGRTWQEAKTQAECYDYLFRFAGRMRGAGFDPGATVFPPPEKSTE